MQTRIISTVHEVTHNGYVYRIIEDKRGCMIKRTKAGKHEVWSHGVLVELVDNEIKEFVPVCLVKEAMFFPTVADATEFLGKY